MYILATVIASTTNNNQTLNPTCKFLTTSVLNVTVCLPLPCVSLPIFVFSCHHYLISLHLCLDFIPGVSSYVPLHIVCSAPCFVWIIVNV